MPRRKKEAATDPYLDGIMARMEPREESYVPSYRECAPVEDLVEQVKAATGVGFRMMFQAPTQYPASRLVSVSWESMQRLKLGGHTSRSAFAPSIRACLLLVLEYERVARSDGIDAADQYLVRERAQVEAAAVARMEER